MELDEADDFTANLTELINENSAIRHAPVFFKKAVDGLANSVLTGIEPLLTAIQNRKMTRHSTATGSASRSSQTIHRIYTERKNSRGIARLLAGEFESFSLHPTIGYYRGGRETAIAIEVIGASDAAIRRVSERIRKMNGQKSVLIITSRATVESIRW